VRCPFYLLLWGFALSLVDLYFLPNYCIRYRYFIWLLKQIFRGSLYAMGHFVIWVVSWSGSFRDGTFSDGIFCDWDLSWLGRFVMGHYVTGHFVMGRFVMGCFVCESNKFLSINKDQFLDCYFKNDDVTQLRSWVGFNIIRQQILYNMHNTENVFVVVVFIDFIQTFTQYILSNRL
jgi:hypothetical protein